MSIRLNTLEIENFNSFKGKHKIEFRKSKRDDISGNFILINGVDKIDQSSNGAGKSSIIDSIVYSLFGKSMKKELNLDDLICRSENFMSVSLEFTHHSDNNNVYKITRTRFKSPSSSTFVLEKNGVICNSNLTNTETQTCIEEILGINFLTFLNNNISNTDLFKFIKASNTQKVEILEKALNLGVIGKCYSNILKFDSSEKVVLESVRHEYNAFGKALKGMEQQEENFVKNIEDSIEALKKNIESKKEEVKKITEELMILGDKKAIVDKAREETEGKLNGVLMDTNTILYEIKTTEESLNFYKNNQTCITCKQELRDRDNLIKEKENFLKTLQKNQKIKSNEIQKLRAKLNTEEEKTIKEEIQKLLRKEENCRYSINTDAITIKKYEAIIKENKNSNSNIEQAKKKVSDLEKELKKTEKSVEISSYWKDAFAPKSPMRAILTENLLNILNIGISKYINNFFHKNVALSFRSENNNIIEKITIDGNPVKYDQLSSGEKQKIDITIILSLLYITMTHFKNNNLKFLIMDESFDHIDHVSSFRVAEILKQYSTDLGIMIIIISHSPAMSDIEYLFDFTISACKGLGGNSSIECSNNSRDTQ